MGPGKIKGMRRGRGAGPGAVGVAAPRTLSLCSGDSPVYPHGRLSNARARGQMDREEVQWEDIYANSSMSLLLGVLNIV